MFDSGKGSRIPLRGKDFLVRELGTKGPLFRLRLPQIFSIHLFIFFFPCTLMPFAL